jgi:ubiquinone/menaquinone biosynthesis C-methylase UbiE
MEMTCERLVIGPNFTADTQQEHLERYRYAAGFARDAEVIDIACGSGYGSRMLADAGAKWVRGYDISRDATDYATANYSTANVTFAAGDAQDLAAVADASADLVVSFETIEHLQHVDKYLDEMHRLLKPGGQFIVSTPDRRLASTMYPLRGRPNNPYHVQEFTRRQFEAMLRRRFEIVDFAGQNYVAKPLVFWPLQVSLKATAYALRKLGAYRLIRNAYHVGSGFPVKPAASFKMSVARFWVVRCRKPE